MHRVHLGEQNTVERFQRALNDQTRGEALVFEVYELFALGVCEKVFFCALASCPL